MKIIVRILTFYMLGLALIPCGDGGNGIIEWAKHVLKIEHQEYSDHDQHSNTCGDDNCTPFCICSCCASVLDYPKELSLLVVPPKPISSTTDAAVPTVMHSSFSPSIWQPPQFC